jgi:crotonobetainyl-CoA:carnitine CoA-transferase CaiB-like acyl-CoA transferase
MLSEAIETVTGKISTEEILGKLNGIVPSCKVVEKIEEVLTNEQIKYRKSLFTVGYDGSKMIMTGVPFQFSGCDHELDCSSPSLGEHTDAILREMGYDSKKISALHEKGVVQLCSKP